MSLKRYSSAKKQAGFAAARRLLGVYRTLAALVGLFLIVLGISAHAATIEEVNAEIAKASEILKSTASESRNSAEQRAKTLSDAIDHLHTVVEMIEKVPNLTPDERDKKSSEVMTIIFWCKKMMPLDLSGGSIAVAKSSGNASSSKANSGDQPPPVAAKADKTTELDEVAFNRAKAFAAAHPNDFEGNAARFESVAACYAGSKWAEMSLREVQQIRTKLEAQRNSQQPLMLRMEKLELAEVVDSLAKDLAAENAEPKKNRLLQTKTDIETLKNMFDKFVKYAEGRLAPLNIPFEELGLNRKGVIKSANKTGVLYTADNQEAHAESALLAWSDFGAKAMIRLAQKMWPATDVEALVQRAIAATVCEEYIAAQNCFSRLLNFDSGRVKDLNAYFLRAQYGYTTSAEVLARARFNDTKGLFKKKDFKSGMAALSQLQQDLASNSALATLLKEVNRFRGASRRQYEIDDAGNPISQFERVMRATFAGNVKVDENSGKLEAYYDFSNPDQFRDWTQTILPAKKPPVPDWTLHDGRAVCSGLGSVLTWRFPLSEFSVTADIVYQESAKKVLIYSCLTKDNNNLTWSSCGDGAAKLFGSRGWSAWSSARFVWRAGETANVRWVYAPSDPNPQQIYVNDNLGLSININFSTYTPGGIGFAFEAKGTGSVTNVHISGKLDMTAFKAMLIAGQH